MNLGITLSIQNKQNNVQKHRNTGSTEQRGPQCQGFDAAFGMTKFVCTDGARQELLFKNAIPSTPYFTM